MQSFHACIRHYSPRRQQTDCVGTHHGNLTPPRISPSCPHCLLPVLPGAVAGQEYHYWIADEGRAGRNQPQCETARHRLLCGRMGTALHLPWPSLMRAHGPHRWSWRILQRRSSPPPGGPLVSGRIPLPDMKFSRLPGSVVLDPVPSRFPASRPAPLNCPDRNMALGICRCPKGQTFKVIVALNGNN